jgi:hypothetical protein
VALLPLLLPPPLLLLLLLLLPLLLPPVQNKPHIYCHYVHVHRATHLLCCWVAILCRRRGAAIFISTACKIL